MATLKIHLFVLLFLFVQNVASKPNLPAESKVESIISKNNASIDFEAYPGEQCNRECKNGDQRICYFKFVLEYYQAMGVACKECLKGNDDDCNNPQCVVDDGIEKAVMSFNRQVPGPAIQVCKNDRVIIDLKNQAGGTAASIHWHGILQRTTPWMDGVPFVTQCPISFSNTFRYQFVADEAGTYFYHSHAGHHKTNGQYGALVVRQPVEKDANSENYDFDLPEHYILISESLHTLAEDLLTGLPSSSVTPDSLLINGRGTFRDRKTFKRTFTPPTRYYVEAGKRYRFRIINSMSFTCPAEIQIQGHRMKVIASDATDLSPQIFDTIVTNSGERYDIVVETDQKPGDYWIRVRGLGVCTSTDSVALLRYRINGESDKNLIEASLPQIPEYNDVFPKGVSLNDPTSPCFDNGNNYCTSELKSLEPDYDYDLRFNDPDYQFYLNFKNHLVDNNVIFRKGNYPHFLDVFSNMTFMAGIKNISLVFPDFPPLTQPENIDESTFCDSLNRPKRCEEEEVCQCVHRIKVKLGSTVEFIVVDESGSVGNIHHPFHLHGTTFIVVGMGQNPYQRMTVNMAKTMDAQHLLLRDLQNDNPPRKDTVTIPSFGYAIIRFRANNPGYWLLHCHYQWHLGIGMGLIVQVGENSEMVPPPPGFPKCGNYQPNLLV